MFPRYEADGTDGGAQDGWEDVWGGSVGAGELQSPRWSCDRPREGAAVRVKFCQALGASSQVEGRAGHLQLYLRGDASATPEGSHATAGG